MSEIAVKALSPGINDPGTAIKTVDLLSVLLSRRLALSERDFASLPDEPPRLCYQELPLDQLLAQYQRGAELLRFCRSRLDAVEQQIRVFENGESQPWSPQ